MIRKRTLNHHGGHHASTPLPPTTLRNARMSNRTGVDVTSPAHRGRDVRTNYQFRPAPEVTGFKLLASSSSGTMEILFPDGWHYQWTGLSPAVIWSLLADSDPRYFTPAIPQGLVLTDHASAESALLHVTNRRAFRLLGAPGSAAKTTAPVGFDVEWNVGLDWSPTVWHGQFNHFNANFPSFAHSSSGKTTTGSLTITNGNMQNLGAAQTFGFLTVTCPATPANAHVVWSSNRPVSDWTRFEVFVAGDSGVYLQTDIFTHGYGTFDFPLTVGPETGVGNDIDALVSCEITNAATGVDAFLQVTMS